MVESLAKVLVNVHGFVVAVTLLRHLLAEFFTLLPRVVQLRVCIAQFCLIDEQLKAFGQVGLAAVWLCQRRHDFGMFANERRVCAQRLDKMLNELVQEASRATGRTAVDFQFSALVAEELRALWAAIWRRDCKSTSLFDALNHVDPLPRSREVNVNSLAVHTSPANLVATGDFLDHTRDHFLGHAHQVIVVSIRHVELARRKLRVVCQVNALVTELAADFIHAIEAADDEHLEVQFGCHAHVHLLLKVVVVGLEGAGGGAASDDVHHWSLDLQEIL
mmetsp:Transcript_25132/g.36944  ORF Transcript_25132/g.36944 Transcript_25132/m.36944 type:complete len:276 (+) Transcript_25132:461-1288(+)